MIHIVLATRNTDKLEELRHLLKDVDVEITFLADYPEVPDITEDGATFLENARKKALVTAKATGKWVLADDSGLVVHALGGHPGVNSARYVGKQGDYAANNKKLIDEMEGIPDKDRGAVFVSAMVLVSPDGREWSVEGKCGGIVLREARGNAGFGYDPLFFIPEEGKTMAELSMARKNKISHRSRALEKAKKILVEILQNKGKI